MTKPAHGLILPPGDFEAYLFDCDGTIADTMPLHYVAWQAALVPWKCEFPVDLFYQFAGMRAESIIERLNAINGLSIDVEAVNELKEKYYLAHLSEIRPVESVVEHILHGHKRIRMAVVSGSPHLSVIKTLNTLGLLHYFDENAIVGAEDYDRAKPDPDPFLTAARRLKVSPEKCLVFEDADLGIESAVAAGMAFVKVETAPITR